MRLRSYLFALAVAVLLPVMVVYGLLVAGNRGSARLLVEILRPNETIRQSLWTLIAEAGGLAAALMPVLAEMFTSLVTARDAPLGSDAGR